MRVMLLERAGIVFFVSVDSVRKLSRFHPDQVSPDGSQIAWQGQTIPLLYLENGLTYSRPTKPFAFPNVPTIAQPTLLVDDSI